MSTLESFIWHFLGYSAMPIIFIVGFLLSAALACFLLELTNKGGGE
ncbi:MAG: TIGR02808 family protein [Photobacterium frigidiphilum]